MAERPIIFGTWAIPKLLDGSKTQTRRTKGLEKINKNPDEWVQPYQLDVDPQLWTWRSTKTGEVITIKCPYGKVGDGLWVREVFWIEHDSEWSEYSGKLIDCGINIAEDSWAEVRYCATDKEPDGDERPLSVYSKHPSLHMPRWASRIDLTITEVRAERLQGISYADCRAEGSYMATDKDDEGGFVNLWDSLNAKRYPWSINPWEWPITFELVK